MNPIILKNQTLDGEIIQATFLPEKGMNMISYKRGNIEVIDQSTIDLFEDHYAGLGALIGPHFHHRKNIPLIKNENLFPHIARLKAKGVEEPFSHGIVRYAPWKVDATEKKLTAKISGKDLWNGVSLADLEGQDFTMTYNAEMTSEGLEIYLSVVSEAASVVGLHYYYRLPEKSGKIFGTVQNHMIKEGQLQPIPLEWYQDLAKKELKINLKNQSIDSTFYPFPDPLQGMIRLETKDYCLETSYDCPCQENCWQLYHPAGSSFVCIEPLSSQDPRHPNLTASMLKIRLNILSPPILQGQ